MDVVRWALELKDKVTPAGRAIDRTFSKVAASAKTLGTKALGVASKGFADFRKKVNEGAPDVAKAIAKWGAASAIGLVLAGGKLTHDAQRFKDSTLIATRSLLKSNELAGTAFKRMLDFAHFFGEDPTEAIARFNNALASGFSARDAEKLLQAFGDLRLVTPNVNVDSLVGAFGEIRKKAKLELGDFQAAVSAGGLNLTLAYEAIGKKIGKNAKETEALIGSGRVNAQVGLVGLLEAINQRTNSTKVGERLNEYANTASGLVDRLKNLPQQFMLRMTADDSPIKGTLKKLLEQLDPDGPNGKRIIGALNTAFGKISEILGTWATPEGIESLTKTIGQVIEAAPKIIKALGAISGVVMVIVDAFASFRDNLRFLWAEFKRGSLLLGSLAAAALYGLNPLIAIGAFVYSVGKVVAEWIPKITGYLGDLTTKALKWGSDIVDGLWKGLKNAWAGLLTKIKGLVDLLPEAVKKTLGIASPSKVFAAEVGQHIPSGVAFGAVKAAPKANAEIVDAIDGGRRAAATSVSSSVTTTSSSLTKSSKSVVVHAPITVEGTKDGRGVGRNIARELAMELERAALG